MPIFGIIAAQKQANLNSYQSIATTIVGAGGSSTISFTSIPSGYKHLQVRYIANWTGATPDYTVFNYTFNSDTTANYSYHQLYGAGSSTGASSAGVSTSNLIAPWVPYTTYTNVFGAGVIDILDYANTNKYKTSRALGGFDRNTAPGVVGLISGSWRSTTAINAITFSFAVGSSFGQYSTFALYGIKG